MNDPPFCMNLATENAKSSAGRCGTGPPNSVYLQANQRKYKNNSQTQVQYMILSAGTSTQIYQPVQASVHNFGL